MVEPNAGPRALKALSLSLDAVGLRDASVCFFSGEALILCILSLQPRMLVAVGDTPGREIDSIHHPLARNSFSEAIPGTCFPWTPSIAGLVLPSITAALEDPDAKRRFWSAFRRLRYLPDARKD
ncbi:hypothetical protein [Rubrobacter calidifluminis]|uniref:hypothetical protein n=1 Tax=Rubrobacter calidifluminis TaxID=1392640 RepID=UPI0023600F59|nr:hypothetical protein [Rubrobacter calidifluminis]